MRVITGTAKGTILKTPRGDGTRPTSDKVKEAMFSALQFDIEGAVALDLFAGSGQLGIEALSRGAAKVYFNDGNPAAAAIIGENLKKTGFSDCQYSRVDRLPFEAFLRVVKANFDIAFLDPPYGKGIIWKVLPVLFPKMNENSIIVCEHEKELCLPEKVDAFKMAKNYHYGEIGLTILKKI